MRNEEEQIQAVVVRHLRVHHPEVLFTCAPATCRSVVQGARNKRMGYLKGFPDLFIACPKKGFHGLFVELKTEKGKVSPEQSTIITQLHDLGYKSIICRSAYIAITEVDAYLK